MKPITLATLPDATEQEVFDWVVGNLLKQGAKSLNDEGDCRYRGDDGLKCAAGWCISDEEYSRIGVGIEGSVWGNSHAPGFAGIAGEHRGFLVRLQNVHDDYGVCDWPAKFKKLADEYGLDTGVLEESQR